MSTILYTVCLFILLHQMIQGECIELNNTLSYNIKKFGSNENESPNTKETVQTYNLLTRDQWLAMPPTTQLLNLNLPVNRIIINQTATEPCYSQATCILIVRYIQMVHIKSKGFNDIAYNFLIGGDGSIYEGRGWDKIGQHTNEFNNDSICLAFIGQFSSVTKPSQQQLSTAKYIIKEGQQLGKIGSNYILYDQEQLFRTDNTDSELISESKKLSNLVDDNLQINRRTLPLITRNNWLAQLPTSKLHNLQQPVKLVIIAHTATTMCNNEKECSLLVKSIQTYHIESRGLDDLIYNFLISGNGLIYEGRGWDFIGAHTKGFNNISICIAFIGNFNDIAPTETQLKATEYLIDEGVRLGKLSADYQLKGHRQLIATESPGEILFNNIKQWPHFSNNNESNSSINGVDLTYIKESKFFKYIIRSEWSAQPPSEVLENLTLPVENIIIAHTATQPCHTQATCKFRVRYIQTFHIESRRFNDIAYNFLIGADGSVYEGRGWDKIGAHTKGHNSNSICIAFIGNFNLIEPTVQQLNVTKSLIDFGIKLGKIKSNFNIYGQKQLVATESPGKFLFEKISMWSHFGKTLL